MNQSVYFWLCLFTYFFNSTATANNATYEQRKLDYADSALASGTGARIVLQAYKDVTVDSTLLANKLAKISTGETSDFDIIELVRICYLSTGAYDAQILPVLNSVPYWINKGDTVRNYWSENHSIMWMGSDWLLHERYGRAIDADLDNRLRHYLHMKIDYGFYEFFSSVYAPYSLSGLLNLADFAQDADIKNLATLAAQRLLKDLLLLTNDKGVFYPAAGRNYPGKYINPYNQSHYNLIYLLTGMGQAPVGASAGGAFLASSNLPVDDVINSWAAEVDTLYALGHTLEQGKIINSTITNLDRVIAQWNSGAYFHPDVVQETAQLLVDSSMWNHVDFALLKGLSFLQPNQFPSVANDLSCISRSSVSCGQSVAIFKQHSVTLSSIQDYWKGKVGFQQYPCVANVGTTAVYTGSGQPVADWEDRDANSANSHLPYVKQKSNVALLMYRPEPTPDIIGPGFAFKEVALHFRDADFDEIDNDSLWLLARQGASYVAVKKSCNGEINTVRACPTVNGQTWVIAVGDSGMYGSFTNFKTLIHQSQFEEKWYYDSVSFQSVYYAKIVLDTTTIEYAWGIDSGNTVGIIKDEPELVGVTIAPNPASNYLEITTENISEESEVTIYNTIGKLVYKVTYTGQKHSVSTSAFSDGMYLVKLKNKEGKTSVNRIMIAH